MYAVFSWNKWVIVLIQHFFSVLPYMSEVYQAKCEWQPLEVPSPVESGQCDIY